MHIEKTPIANFRHDIFSSNGGGQSALGWSSSLQAVSLLDDSGKFAHPTVSFP